MSHIVDMALNALIAVLILAIAGIILLWALGKSESQSSQYHPLERSCGVHIVCVAA